MKVYVVMGNDYPDRVYEIRRDAEEFCLEQNAKNEKGKRPIYWCVYEFELISFGEGLRTRMII